MKSAALALLLPLAACGPSKTDHATLNAVEAEQRRDVDDERIPCARPGETALKPTCVVERTDGREGLILTIRHPDGGFRRLVVTRDGRGVAAADGAEPAQVSVLGADRIEVTIAGERYQLPATVKPR